MLRRRLVQAAIMLAAFIALGWLGWLWIRPPLIDVHGQRFEARQAGKGTPSVVFESGFTGEWYLWLAIQWAVSEYARTLVYERAGIGRSSPGTVPHTADSIATDLHALLETSGFEPPYVLVGHSAGGLFVRVFAHKYPSEVAAIVLIDPATEVYYRRMLAESREFLAQLTERMSAGLLAQWKALPESLDQAAQAWPLPAVPIYVVRANQPLGQWPIATAEDLAVFSSSQRDLEARLSGVKDTVVATADHMSILRAPEVEAAIRSAWLDAASAMRSNTSLERSRER